MSIVLAPKGQFVIRHKRPATDKVPEHWEALPVLAFNENGTAMIAGRFGLVEAAGELEGRFGFEPQAYDPTPIPAEPGWYAVFRIHFDGDDEDDVIERLPVVAWRDCANGYGSSALVIGENDSEDIAPCDAKEREEEHRALELVGYFHPEHRPEDDLFKGVDELQQGRIVKR
jgi:hypothetical protein